jgi:thiol:disulfide interchange protein DsbD
MVIKKWFLYLLLSGMAVLIQPQFFNDQAVPEPEIQSRIVYEKSQVVFSIRVPENHHITDRKHGFFWIKVEENPYIRIDQVAFPAGETLGDETVYKGEFQLTADRESLREINATVKLKFSIGYQMCREKPGEVCFAPSSEDIQIEFTENFRAQSRQMAMADAEKKSGLDGDESFSRKIEGIIRRELDKKSLLLFLLVFLAGFLTSLTPCVYPVIPIVMGYIGTRSGKNRLKGFYLSIFFVLGLSLVYSILGVIAAKTGSLIGISFQNPLVVVIIAAIFIVMGLSLAGLFEIPVPASISSGARKGYRNEIVGSLIIGGISGIIAAPCVGPVLIALLSWVSQTGNIILGFWLTFTFSLGLGMIFLLVGTFSGIISSLPKGGAWMSGVKHLFSILLIAGGLYFLSTITAAWVDLLLWGIFLISLAVFGKVFAPQLDESFINRLFRVVLVLILLTGGFLFFKSLEMKFFPVATTRTAQKAESSVLNWFTDLDQGTAAARKENRMLMVDTAADWCVACKELDEFTFSHPEVSAALRNFILVKLDFSRRTEKSLKLQKSLNIIGLPTVIFFNSQGTEIKRFSGFKNQREFLKILSLL